MKRRSSIQILCLLCLVALVTPSLALFDLYIPKSVMQQVIKTFQDSKVYYVYNGTVNRYALKFKISIPMEVDKLYFSWINRAKQKMPYSIGFTVSNQLAMDTPVLNISSQGFVPQEESGFEVSLPCTGKTESEVTFGIHINVTMNPQQQQQQRPANATSLSITRSKICPQRNGGPILRHPAGGERRNLGVPTPNNQVELNAGASAAAANQSPASKSRTPEPGGGDSNDDSTGDDSASTASAWKFSAKAFAILAGASALSLGLIGTLVAVYFCRSRQAANGGSSSSGGGGGSSRGGCGGGGSSLLTSKPGCGAAAPLTSGTSGIGSSGSGYRGGGCGSGGVGGMAFGGGYQSVGTNGHNQQHHQLLGNNYSKVETCSQTSGYTSCSLPSHHRPGAGSPQADRRIVEASRDLLRDLRVPWERITLKCILMEGHYGRVYRGSMKLAMAPTEEEEVLIKTVSDFARPDQVNEFLEQASALCDLQHHNISCVLASSQIPGDPRPHLIYPYPTEGNLKLFLIRCRSAQTTSVYCVLSTQQLISMAMQIAKGLHHIHRKRIIHGDVACRNCVLTGDYNVKLCDAALSKDLFPEDYQCLHGYDSRPVKWMSPESLVDGKCSTAGDVWSFGVALWELITRCQQPYPELDSAHMPKHLRDGSQLAKPANCPDQLYTIMSSCWQFDPDQRPRLSQIQTAIGDFSDALKSYV